MFKKCPYCERVYDVEKEAFVCPYCATNYPKENIKQRSSNNNVNTNVNYGNNQESKKKTGTGFRAAFLDYQRARAHYIMYYCPILGIVFAIISVVGAILVSPYMLFCLILSGIFFLLAFANYVFYKNTSNKN